MTLAIMLLLAYVPFFIWMYMQGREDWKKLKNKENVNEF